MKTVLHGYGKGRTTKLGTTSFTIKVNMETSISAFVVSSTSQEILILLRRNFTEMPGLLADKDEMALTFFNRNL